MPGCPRGTLFDATSSACVAAELASCPEPEIEPSAEPDLSTIPTAQTVTATTIQTSTESQSADISSGPSTIPIAPTVPRA